MYSSDKISRSHLSPQLLHLCNTCNHDEHHHNHHQPQRQDFYVEKNHHDLQEGQCDSTKEDTPIEFLTDPYVTATDLCPDISLGLDENESESWTQRVGEQVARNLKEIEVKRQEYVNEFILTEKRHCITLLAMQKIFVYGLRKHFHLSADLERMFPRLSDLIELHLEFLSHLRKRQRQNEIVPTITDILERKFSNQGGHKLKCVYGEFCSKHKGALEIYKNYVETDHRFRKYIRYCQLNPLLEKKGIPECILFVTQRLTKYPLLIEALIKTSKENEKEQEALRKILNLVKGILVDVNTQVAEKEKEDRKLEIYNKIVEDSYTVYRGLKFERSDILLNNRHLKFEGTAFLLHGTKILQVVVVILSDILFFLQTSSHQYTFLNPENKIKVVSLRRLVIRDRTGPHSRIIHLVSSNKLYELEILKPRDKQAWVCAIKDAIECCSKSNENRVLLNVENYDTLPSSKQPENKMADSQPKLPINLLSTTNQRKLPQNVEVKQQIPLKLASQFS